MHLECNPDQRFTDEPNALRIVPVTFDERDAFDSKQLRERLKAIISFSVDDSDSIDSEREGALQVLGSFTKPQAKALYPKIQPLLDAEVTTWYPNGGEEYLKLLCTGMGNIRREIIGLQFSSLLAKRYASHSSLVVLCGTNRPRS